MGPTLAGIRRGMDMTKNCTQPPAWAVCARPRKCRKRYRFSGQAWRGEDCARSAEKRTRLGLFACQRTRGILRRFKRSGLLVDEQDLANVREAARIKAVLNAEDDGVDLSALHIGAIDGQALKAFDTWGSTEYFEWDRVPKWKRRKGIDIALWFGPELCGLCFAEPVGESVTVQVILLEGKPDRSHPLKGRVAAIALATVAIYGQTIGSKRIEIDCPANGALDVYRELGFTPTANGNLDMAIGE